MKKLIIPFFLLLANQSSLAQSSDSLYKEIGEASVQVRSNKDGASSYSTVETTYMKEYLQLPSQEQQYYLAKFRTSTTVKLGHEGKDRTI